MAGSMTGMTEEEYRDMMIDGGRSVEGNRDIGEDGDAQAQHQPQGAAGREERLTWPASPPSVYTSHVPGHRRRDRPGQDRTSRTGSRCSRATSSPSSG